MSEEKTNVGMGWLPDPPDMRDYSLEREEVPPKLKSLGQKPVKTMLDELGVLETKKKLSPTQDLSRFCSAVDNQEYIGSCTAHAAVGLLEYFEKRAFGKHIDASRLFLYKVTRNLLHWTGDEGAYLRTTMGALTLVGVPPEEYWPYKPADFDQEPPAFCYALAQNYQTVQYFRLDTPGVTEEVLLERIKTFLAGGLPLMFGFRVYNSIWQIEDGKIPYPIPLDNVVGGHAVLAVGYDDKIKIKNPGSGGLETEGALLIRNSWGEGWGDKGYGWLPYQYVLSRLAVDWWSLLETEWIEKGDFD
ncbi:MAG: cysteine protease [Anaerolineae bacterium]|nr:cysteine protease [Anaerolineae bacterium]